MAIVCGLLAGAAIGDPAGNDAKALDWPWFLGPERDGKSTESILLEWPEDGPEVLWFQPVGEGYSAPSIASGRVFVFDRIGDQARLRALREQDGSELWSSAYETRYEDLYGYSGGPRTSPVVEGKSVYTYGVEGRLRAHSVENGDLLWEVDTVEGYGVVQNFFGVGSTPVVEGALLIAQVGGSPPDSPPISSGEVRGNGSGIVAFDKRTGLERYRLTDELASYSSFALTSFASRRWAFVLTRGGLVAFEPGDGSLDFFLPWRAKLLESVNAATPVVVTGSEGEHAVFVSETYGPGSALVRVAADGSEIVWRDERRKKSLRSHWATPIFHRGTLYGSSGRSTGEAELRAIDAASGRVLWSHPGLGRSTLLFADDHLLVLTEKGRLLLIEANPKRFVLVAELDLGDRDRVSDADAKTGPGKGSADRPRLRFPAWNAPALSRGRLYLRGKDQIVVLDLGAREGEVAIMDSAASVVNESH